MSTVSRETSILRDKGLIEYSHQRYSIPKDADSGNFYSTETKNKLALVAALKGILQQYKNTPLFRKAEQLILAMEPEAAKADGVLSTPRVAVPPLMEYNVNQFNWDKVYSAMMQNRKIQFRYTAPYKKSDSLRIISPYQLLLKDGDVYVFAYSDYAGKELLYMLNRMEGIVITNKTFTLPADYDFASRCGGGRLGAFKGNRTERYKIEFFDYASFWIKDHKLADDQTYTETDESIIIEFTSSQDGKILELILGFGSNARPLAPQSLVNRWKDEIATMAKMSSEY